MMKWILCLYISIFSVTAFAHESLSPKILNSADYRERSSGTVMAGYQFLTNWIPFKWTLGYSYLFNQKWSAEIEWSRGSYGIGAFGFDAARVTENRYSLIARRYVGNSFHFIMGGFKSDLHGELGDSMLKKMTDTSVDDFRVQGVGVALGLGNRWQWNNGLTLGVDWFRLNVPLIYKKVDNGVLDAISDSNDLSIIKDSIQKVKNLPTIVLFGLHLGYSF